MGKKIIKRVITCEHCNKKMNLDELIELQYVEEIGKIKVISCPHCEVQFILK